MNIRFVGGFLSAYSLTEDAFFLKSAQMVADLLLLAFKTKNGLPAPVVFANGDLEFPDWYPGFHCTLLSDLGSLHMEFSYLSELTGKTWSYRNRPIFTIDEGYILPHYMNSQFQFL